MELKRRQSRLVFVDPEDEEIPYWWPAIVVPEEEYELFKETMDNDAGVDVGTHERLVCYFEDGSFSVVPKSGLIPFHPQREPYKSYSTRLKRFLTDAGVKRATDYHDTGNIPKMFKWLILGETGYLDPADDSEEVEEEVEEEQVEEEIVGKDISLESDINAEEDEDDEIIEIERRDKKQKKNHHKERKDLKDAMNKKDKKKARSSSLPTGNKRGRKPKNQSNSSVTISTDLIESYTDNNTNDSLSIQSHDPILSPKTINPMERMKIEALISSASNDSASVAI